MPLGRNRVPRSEPMSHKRSADRQQLPYAEQSDACYGLFSHAGDPLAQRNLRIDMRKPSLPSGGVGDGKMADRHRLEY